MERWALDLFCGAGGATRGLQMAGFRVVGIDIKRQPRYCGDRFIQADALLPPVRLSDFDLTWASPPCQRWTPMVVARRLGDRHPDHVAATRELLCRSGKAFVIENVPGAPLRTTLTLSGEMFNLDTYRKRNFETSFLVLAPRPGRAFGPISRPGSETVVGHPGGHSRRDSKGEYRMRGDLARWREVMQIPWMLGREIVEAVPPAYSEFIGKAAMRFLDG